MDTKWNEDNKFEVVLTINYKGNQMYKASSSMYAKAWLEPYGDDRIAGSMFGMITKAVSGFKNNLALSVIRENEKTNDLPADPSPNSNS